MDQSLLNVIRQQMVQNGATAEPQQPDMGINPEVLAYLQGKENPAYGKDAEAAIREQAKSRQRNLILPELIANLGGAIANRGGNAYSPGFNQMREGIQADTVGKFEKDKADYQREMLQKFQGQQMLEQMDPNSRQSQLYQQLIAAGTPKLADAVKGMSADQAKNVLPFAQHLMFKPAANATPENIVMNPETRQYEPAPGYESDLAAKSKAAELNLLKVAPTVAKTEATGENAASNKLRAKTGVGRLEESTRHHLVTEGQFKDTIGARFGQADQQSATRLAHELAAKNIPQSVTSVAATNALIRKNGNAGFGAQALVPFAALSKEGQLNRQNAMNVLSQFGKSISGTAVSAQEFSRLKTILGMNPGQLESDGSALEEGIRIITKGLAAEARTIHSGYPANVSDYVVQNGGTAPDALDQFLSPEDVKLTGGGKPRPAPLRATTNQMTSVNASVTGNTNPQAGVMTPEQRARLEQLRAQYGK